MKPLPLILLTTLMSSSACAENDKENGTLAQIHTISGMTCRTVIRDADDSEHTVVYEGQDLVITGKAVSIKTDCGEK